MAAVVPIQVASPSGQPLRVLGQSEVDFYNSEKDKYLSQNGFTNNSDLLDLDRLLFLELIAYRQSVFIGAGRDYDGLVVNTKEAERTLKEANDQIGKIKSDLGINKSARDKAQAESVGAYLSDLKARAKEFGVHREKQLTKAITLCQQLFSIIGAYDRSDETERGKIGFETEAEILDWIREVMRPEFDAVDAHFRQHQQRYWVRRL